MMIDDFDCFGPKFLAKDADTKFFYDFTSVLTILTAFGHIFKLKMRIRCFFSIFDDITGHVNSELAAHGSSGSERHANGASRVGPFKHGKLHGANGLYTLPNGDTYKGTFVNGLQFGLSSAHTYFQNRS